MNLTVWFLVEIVRVDILIIILLLILCGLLSICPICVDRTSISIFSHTTIKANASLILMVVLIIRVSRFPLFYSHTFLFNFNSYSESFRKCLDIFPRTIVQLKCLWNKICVHVSSLLVECREQLRIVACAASKQIDWGRGGVHVKGCTVTWRTAHT